MYRFYSILVDFDDDSSQSYLRKKKHLKCIKDSISNRFLYFATSLLYGIF
ncbi:MAG: hypothetical protein ABIJ03_01175 [Patescibacteria group bacterium]